MSRKAEKNKPLENRNFQPRFVAELSRRGPECCIVLAVCGALVLAVFLVFGQTAQFDFVNLDDDQYISGEVTGGLSARGVAWAFTHGHVGNWHPLTSISFMLDWQLFGSNAGGYHVHNVLLHAAAAALLFLALRRMTGALWPSAVAAAIFAVHPLRVESVAWVTERKDVLSGLFLMLTLWAYAVYATRPFSLFRYSVVFVFFAMGLMSKSILVTTPLVLLLLDYWPLGRFEGRDAETAESETRHWTGRFRRPAWLMIEKVPLLLLSAAFSITTVISTGDPVRPIAILPLSVRIANAPVAYVSYLGQIFYPFGLAIHYPYSEHGPPVWRVVAACCVLLLISAAVFLARRRYPYFLVGWLWYLVTLLPVIGLMPGGIQFLADRYTYVTQIGLYVALVWAAVDLSRSWPRRAWVCGIASAVVISGLMLRAWFQTSHWRDSEALWRHTLACTTENAFAHGNLGSFLQNSGRTSEAIEHYQQALRIVPDSLASLNNLGSIRLGEGKADEAVALYQRVVKVNPKFAEAYYNLGNARRVQGKTDEAIACYEKVLELEPNHAWTCNNLANLLAQKGELDKAVAYYRKAVETDPGFALAHHNLGATLCRLGRLDEAISHFRKALKIRPNYPEAHNNLGTCLGQLGRIAEAIAHYRKALALKPDLVDARRNLGVILLQRGRIQEALAQWRELIRLHPDDVTLLNDVAWTLATYPKASIRNGAEAVQLAERATELSGGGSPAVLGTLAAAYAEAGRFSEAVNTARKALDLAAQQNEKRLADVLRERLKLYQSGAAFRDSPLQ